ncbi:hypothetical protein A2348_04955 [Candidatus Uhrbacteria bacterium RIFOXYB12_FULL_58_10]|uniref:Uncharacterized protein n=1 Tax=Candidatus Uhrbacteria bacterium RIFOXYB2_FULL_57_15 TaxID=1802422 RepID=A0A1F7W9E5_9BACT|nr:MAG: hypothetical protein A2348_04955 [Candidatus Uhrbacteria bacterium RIFOXYB12_FULL_58_10]OGL98817.1 MAG: hypothetical protein A2304_04975 [Candidatus Uhrbacteria bacterium RIFOXYB2_FULL_57_15]OGL99772.1 MAG: hypothetical protein A2501_04580 [Candidatus Uhrbacteria bacterium RIFOXYC12_FULL_57_11]
MAKKIQTKMRTSTTTVVGVALLAGAGLAAAAGLAMMSMRSPALLVRLTPHQPLNVETVAGSEDAALLSFDLQPRGGDATIDEMSFSVFGDDDADFATIDRDANAEDRFMECRLEDAAGTVIAGPEPVSAETLTFSDSFTVAAATATTYVIRCDLSNDGTLSDDPDRFAAALAGESSVTATIGGTTLSGATLQIGRADTLNDTGTISTRVQENGRLVLRPAPDMTASDILLGSTTGNEVGRWEFDARGEDFLVETLSFDDLGSATGAGAASILCTDEGGSGYTDTASVIAGHVSFEGAECYARAGDVTAVTLTVDIVAVGSYGAASGDTLRFTLNALDSGSFSAIGVTSGNSVDETDVAASVSGRLMIIRLSEPSFSLSSASPSGTGVPGRAEALRFNVASSSFGDVTVNQLMFRVTTTDNAGTGWNDCGDGASTKRFGANDLWNLYDMDDLSAPISDKGDWSLLKADGSACGQAAEPVAYAVLNLGADATTGPTDVPAGVTSTLSLHVDTTGASAADDDSVRFDLLSDAEARAVRHQAILWDDTDAGASNINAHLLRVLPLMGPTISY